MKKLQIILLVFAFIFANPTFANSVDTKVVVEHFGDGETLFPEYSMSKDRSILAIAYLKNGGLGKNLNAAISQDAGNSWQFINNISTNASTFNFKVQVSEDGTDITLIWVENRATSSDIWFRQSLDKGNSWGQNQLMTGPKASNKSLLDFNQSRDGKTKLVTFFARSSLDPEFLTAYQISSFDSGRTWVAANNNKHDIRQPYGDTFVSSDGGYLAYVYESYGNKATQSQLRFSSTSDGINWSEEKIIDTGNTFDPKSHFVSLMGSDFAIFNDASNALLLSKDKGKTFQKIQIPTNGFSTRVWMSENGSRIYISTLVSPSSNGRSMRFAFSEDYGKTWIQVLNVNEGIDNENTLSASGDGRIVGILTIAWGATRDVFIQVSGDYGFNWSDPKKVNRNGDLVRVSFAGQVIPMYLDEKNSEIRILVSVQTPASGSSSQQLITVPFYKIEFDGNSNTSGSTPDGLISLDGDEVFIPAKSNDFIKANHTFMGWSKTKNDAGEIFLPGQRISNITSNLKFFAIWKADVVKKITITCTKGKITKKVTGSKPKCPNGFRKK